MSELMTVATELATVLKDAGLPAFPTLPNRITPPVAVVQAGSPFMESGGSFGEFKTRWEITLLTPTGDNSVATEKLYATLEDAIVSLVNSKYSVEQVSKPYAQDANNAVYVAIDLKIYNYVRI